ncbi:MAG: chemotaxis protein CheX [Candidatus Saccharibacteria bacterium]
MIDRSFIEKAYIEAVIKVIDTLAGIKMEPSFDMENGCESVSCCREPHADRNRVDRITGVILLPGVRSSLLLLSLTKENAVQLAVQMTGLEPGELSEDYVLDGVTEVVNQIAGRIRESLYGTEYEFKVTAPFALLGNDYILFQKSNIEYILLNFCGPGMVLNLEAYFLD